MNASEVVISYEKVYGDIKELKPCPFCGQNEQEMFKEETGLRTYYVVRCQNCSARGPETTLHRIIKGWNERTQNE